MSTDERKVQLGVSVDATEARQGFNEVKQGARDMANAVVQEGEKAGAAIGKVGGGAEPAAQKLDTATRSMIQSIQRATAAMDAGKKSGSEYFEALAKQRGVDVNTLRPFLDQLGELERKQKLAQDALNSGAASMNKMGVSTAQTAAALRGVPAQFTDIITSLQGGQAPMTVLLQQGGQLKDMFGGIGPAARALGGYVAGLINPFTLAAAAAGALAVAYNQGSKEADAYTKALIMTGGAAGVTGNQLADMAARVGKSVGTTGAAAAALAELAGTGRVAAGNLEQFSRVAVQMEKTVGQSVGETAKTLAELAKSPVEASEKLNEKFRYLTATVYEQIKALQEQGKAFEAGALAQKAYLQAMDGRVGELTANLGVIERAWSAVTSGAKKAWDAMLGIGRQRTLSDQLSDVSKEIARAQQPFDPAVGGNAEARAKLQANLQLQAHLEEMIRLENKQADAQARNARQDEARINWLKEGEKYLSKTAQMEREVAAAREQGRAAGASQIEIEKRIAEIREKYKEKKAGGGITATDTELASLRSRIDAEKQLAAQLSATDGNVSKLNEGEKLSLDYAEKLKLATNGKTKARLEEMRVMAEQLGVLQRSNASAAEYAKQAEKYMDDRNKEIADIQKKAAALEAENATYGLGKAAIESMTIARLEEHKAILQGFEGSEEQLKLLDQEIDARKRLMAATSQKETLDANKKAAEEAARDWTKTTEQIEQALTNALMQGGKSGKEYIEGLFRTMVLRPIISAVVNPIAGAVSGTLGGQGNGSNAVQSASELYGYYDKLRTGYGLVSSWFGTGGTATGAMFGGTGALAGGVFGAGTGASIFGSGAAGAAYGANAGLSLYGTGTAMSLSGGTAGLGATAGTAGAAGGAGMTGALAAVPVAGWIAMGMAAADSLFSKGWDYQKVDVNTFGKIYGSATFGADRLLRGIGMSDRLANVLSGASTITALFGRKKPEVQAAGIEGDFTADGFDGRAFADWRAKGGLFRRSKSWTDFTALDEDQSSALQGAVKGALGFYRNLDKLAGGAGMAEREDSFAYHVRADLRGEGALDKLLTDMANALGQHVLPQLEQFRREGESLGDTAQRLTDVFSATNTVASVLGKTTEAAFGALGLATSKVRQELVDVAGGLEALSGKVASYYDLYFTQEEKLSRLRSQLGDSFRELGVAMPDSREGFRAIVESLDLTTESGREMFTAMLDLAPGFAQMTDGLAQAGQAMAAFAKQVAEFQQSLRLGDLSTLTPEQQYAEAKRQYDATSAAALSGDSTAQAQWTQIAQAFLEASRGYFSSGARYADDFAAVQGFRPNGSHANGLAYVPFDGYLAELHQGERVLTQAENARYSGPDWSTYGRGENAALVAEIRALGAQVAALKETVRQVEQAKEAQAEARHTEALAVQAKQVRLQQQLVDK